jgi:hypothetical protein
MTLMVTFLPKEQQHSEYDWADISVDGTRVGKSRCVIKNATIWIYSLNIYPAFEGQGYGREFVDYCKSHFKIVYANRVRYNAIGFWEAMGFCNDHDGNWSYRVENKTTT